MPTRPKTHRPKQLRTSKEAYERDRQNSTQRGYGSRWREARAVFLRENPLCCKCHSKGVIVAATVVDHITPHKGDQKLFWKRSNWQPLCKQCHDRKTATETWHNGT